MTRILLAEDDASARDIIYRALVADGHEVVATQDGLEALETLKSDARAFDVLIADINMPGLDGVALAQQAVAADGGIAVLLVSGFEDQLERGAHIKARRLGRISKPFTLDRFRAEIRALIG